jgi:NADP-dependent alcohol dehydrogenase
LQIVEIKDKVADLSAWLDGARAQSIFVVVDAGVTDSSVHRRVLHSAAGRNRRVVSRVVAGAGSVNSVRQLARAVVDADVDTIAVIGGGAAMDQAKLANSMAAGETAMTALLESGDRAGMRVLGEDFHSRCRLVAVPTTIGTGSERSLNAVVVNGDRRLLVSGQALRVDLAILDAIATPTLPYNAVIEGIFEALYRTVSPYIGSAPGSPSADRLAEAVAVRLVAIGNEISRAQRDAWSGNRALRSEVAHLSGLSHSDSMHRGRHPFSFKAWYVTHEMVSKAVTKSQALATVLPAVWQETLAGYAEWGVASRLQTMWTLVRDGADASLDANPAVGLGAVLEHWGIERRGLVARADSLLEDRVLEHWGDELPFLGTVGRNSLTRVLDAACSAHQQSQ